MVRRIDRRFRKSGTGAKGQSSKFQSELAGIAKVAVGEAIEKGKTGDAVKPYRRRGNADRMDIPTESESRNLYWKIVDPKTAAVRTAKSSRQTRHATASQAIRLLQQKFKTGTERTRAGIGEQGAG